MIYREQDIVHPRRTYPFAGDKVFFFVFPGRNSADEIGRFPFTITVACPSHPKADNDLMEFLSVIGVNYKWTSAAEMVKPPSEKERGYRRYSTCRSPLRRQERPLVVDVEAVENPYGISSSDTVRLAGFVALIDGHSPFFDRARIISTAPIDELRMFKPSSGELDHKRTFYSLKGKAFGETRIEDIPLDGLLRTVFDRLHSALLTYQNGHHPDVVSDYVFNLSRILAAELTRAKRVPIRICPVCLRPLPPDARSNQIYCPMSPGRAWCGNVARDRRARKRATQDYAHTLMRTVRPVKAKK